MIGLAEEPKHEKFQAKQRIIYAIFSLTGLTLIGTGLIKSYKNLGAIVLDPFVLQIMAFAHTITGMVFMVLFLMHVAVLVLVYRPMIPSMFSGKIEKSFAKKHHPEWKFES